MLQDAAMTIQGAAVPIAATTWVASKVRVVAKEEAMTIQEQEQTQAAWDKIAVGYDQFVTPTHMWLANEALFRAGLRPGMRFLDVAAGTGALSIPAAGLRAQGGARNIPPVSPRRAAARR
jgi:2-polyprenyl-3-methyl-5-hydroxy-6-metoxy-1,4-benzoquinol methylase